LKKHVAPGFFSRFLGRETDARDRLVKQVRQSPPDLIISNTIATGSILEALSGSGCPIVSRISELETLVQMFGGEAEKVFAHADMFVAASQAVKDNLIRNHGVVQEKVRVIHGFAEHVDVESYAGTASAVRQELGIPADAFVVGNCASLIYGKGFDYFIETAARFHGRQVYFVWVGANSSSNIRLEVFHEIKKRGLHDTVKLVGEQDDVYPYLTACDVFFLSSREDSFPVAMLEAAQCGLPVIGFRKTGGVEEFLAEGGGLLADYANFDDVCSGISSLRNDADFYKKISRESIANFHTYSREFAEKQWLNLITSPIC
jgi:glycosyltransferase involved in cell wall biosynthesis